MSKYISLLLYMVCFTVITVRAQQTDIPYLAERSIQVERMMVEHTDNNLVLNMDLNMDSLSLPSNVRFVFTPLVKDLENQIEMPQIVINGRKQDISYWRSGYKTFAEDVVCMRRKNNTQQTLHYTAIIPFEEWMKNSNIEVVEDLCGCGDVLNQNVVVIRQLRTPYMPYIRPEAEARKERHEEGRAYIDFPVDKITLYPEYRNNPNELHKIVETINFVKNDQNTTITGIKIHGFASPESPYEHNAYLAENRAVTLKNYVCQLLHLNDDIFSIDFTPEDWEGLKNYVVKSDLKNKTAILAIVDDQTLDPDAREQRIKQNYPEDYGFMLTNWYPALRHSDYVVTYHVRPFSVEEAKEILKTKPQQLSLEEMFLVAQTYTPGTQDFNDVMEIAVRMFPEDETANINAACARMESGDLQGARRYLMKAGNSPQALHARGVFAMLNGQMEMARQILEKAKAAGAEEVDKNLQLLEL